MHWLLLPSPVTLLNVPSSHGAGAGEPASQYAPLTHSMPGVVHWLGQNDPLGQAPEQVGPLCCAGSKLSP